MGDDLVNDTEDEEDDKEDQQGRIDRALNSFITAHKLDVNIFASCEWDDVLEAVNDGPVDVLTWDAQASAAPATLLARASIHQIQAAHCKARKAEE